MAVTKRSASVDFLSLYRKLCSSRYRKRWNGSTLIYATLCFHDSNGPDRPRDDISNDIAAAVHFRNAIVYFNDVEHCREFMVELRWPDGK